MSRDINCDYCGRYLCSDYCDYEERWAAHAPLCMDEMKGERDRLRAALEEIYGCSDCGASIDIARDALEGKA